MTPLQLLPHPARALALALCWPAHLIAQTEAGVARDAKTGAPLVCLHVALVDSTDRAVVHTVTDSTGQFLLDAPHPGLYRVRFEVDGWKPLAGPLDTLSDAGYKQRRYPLDLVNMMPAVAHHSPWDTVAVDSARAQREREERTAYLVRRREESAGWTGRKMLPRGGEALYPDGLRRQGITGSVVALMIVDSTGRARVGTWQPISASNPEFEKSVRSALKEWRWTPALLAGKPTCELARGVVDFELDNRVRMDAFGRIPNVGRIGIMF